MGGARLDSLHRRRLYRQARSDDIYETAEHDRRCSKTCYVLGNQRDVASFQALRLLGRIDGRVALDVSRMCRIDPRIARDDDSITHDGDWITRSDRSITRVLDSITRSDRLITRDLDSITRSDRSITRDHDSITHQHDSMTRRDRSITRGDPRSKMGHDRCEGRHGE